MAKTTLMLSAVARECIRYQPHPSEKSDGHLAWSVCGGNGEMKEETQGSFPSKLTVQQLITYIGRTFTDEKVVELQHPLKCTEIIKTNSKDFSVREKCRC